MSVSPAANSVTNLKQNAKKEGSDAEYYKWTLAELDHEGYGGAAYSAKICSEIFSGVRDLSVEDFDEFRNRLFETCVDVLEEMRMEGAFRDISPKAVLVFSATDYEHAQREKEWIARLNAAARAREFADWIDGWDAEACFAPVWICGEAAGAVRTYWHGPASGFVCASSKGHAVRRPGAAWQCFFLKKVFFAPRIGEKRAMADNPSPARKHTAQRA